MTAKKKPAKKPNRTNRTRSKPDWAPAFLAELSFRGIIRDACVVAKIARSAVYTRRDADSDFAARMAEARTDAADRLEKEAWRRAVEGLVRKKFDKGLPVIDPATGEQYVEYEYSDTLMSQLLKARRPDEYRERTEATVKGEVTIKHKLDLSRLSDEDLRQLERLVGLAG